MAQSREDAEHHLKRLGQLHGQLSWLKRHKKVIDADIERIEKSIVEAEKHTPDAFAVLYPDGLLGRKVTEFPG